MITSSNGNIFHVAGHRLRLNFPHKGQWRDVLIFSLVCAWLNIWVNNGGAGDLRRHGAIMTSLYCHSHTPSSQWWFHTRMLPSNNIIQNGPLVRYVKLRVAHVPGMPGTFSPSPRVSNPDMHYGTCVTHLPWCMSGSLISGFPWRRWRGKHSRHSGACATCNFAYLARGP